MAILTGGRFFDTNGDSGSLGRSQHFILQILVAGESVHLGGLAGTIKHIKDHQVIYGNSERLTTS